MIMPLEIKELHIKVNINSNSAPAGGIEAPTNSGNSTSGSSPDQLIASCVEQVLEILEEKMEA